MAEVDMETCSWCTAEVPDAELKEQPDGARICLECQKEVWEYEVQGNYGHGDGWEMVTTETTRAAAMAQKRLYEESEPGIPFRVKKVRSA